VEPLAQILCKTQSHCYFEFTFLASLGPCKMEPRRFSRFQLVGCKELDRLEELGPGTFRFVGACKLGFQPCKLAFPTVSLLGQCIKAFLGQCIKAFMGQCIKAFMGPCIPSLELRIMEPYIWELHTLVQRQKLVPVVVGIRIMGLRK
jgi:hypothetical protein